MMLYVGYWLLGAGDYRAWWIVCWHVDEEGHATASDW